MDAAFMLLEIHGWGIHAVCRGTDGPGVAYECCGAGGVEPSGESRRWAGWNAVNPGFMALGRHETRGSGGWAGSSGPLLGVLDGGFAVGGLLGGDLGDVGGRGGALDRGRDGAGHLGGRRGLLA